MGLFSSHRRSNSAVKDTPVCGKIFVFARSSFISSRHGEGSVEPDISWSLAVEDVPRSEHQDPRAKRRKSMFGMRRASRKGSAASDQTEIFVPSISEPTCITEYTLQDGNLYTTQAETFRCSMDGMQASLLVKAFLNPCLQDATPDQPLSVKIEHVLYSMTSANAHLSDDQSETWIRYALISLQHAKLLPSGNIFDVNSFINYVQNRTTEFEAGLLSASTHEDGGAQVVQEIDYQRHLDESARLKAMFGTHPLDELDDDDNSRRSSTIEGQPGIRGGFGGGFWISRPQGATRMKDNSSLYGGLV